MNNHSNTLIEEVQLLLDLFNREDCDTESNRLVWKFCEEKHRRPKAHGLHSTIRDRTIKAERSGNKALLAQYLFEEAIAKTLFNLTNPDAPFDPDAPYWIIKNGLWLAKELGIPDSEVTRIVT